YLIKQNYIIGRKLQRTLLINIMIFINKYMKKNTIISAWSFLGLLLFFNLSITFPLGIIGAIYSGLFISFIPGILMLSIFQRKLILKTEEILYSLGLSIGSLMFLGLFINWLLPLFGFMHPLTFLPIAVCISIFIVILISIYIACGSEIMTTFNFPKKNMINILFILYSLMLPILSILGTNLLNNNGSNIIILFMLINTAICIVLEFIFIKKIDEK